MSHNPHAQQASAALSATTAGALPRFALSGHRVIALSGRDAVAFAQAQSMNDVDGLPVGRWQWNGWLTPKGRVIALFLLVRVAADVVWLVVPDTDAEALATSLRRFVLRRKLDIAVREDLHVNGAFAAPARAAGASFDGDEATGIELDLGGFGIPRTLRIEAAPAPVDAEATVRWAAADLRLGLARLPPSQAEQWTPQMLSLERLHAYSVKKGCYPGQEIVARTHFLGQAKRGLVLLEAASKLEPGQEVTAGSVAMGKLVAVGADGSRHLALAVMPLERDAVELEVNGAAVVERTLGDGLAR